jgi:hypothetical protein
MNMKKVLAVFSAASALAAATHALPAHAKECVFSILGAPRTCPNGTVASGKAGATFTVVPARPNNNLWTYTWNYEFGPTFPTASVRLLNRDGVTFTKNAVTGNACNPVVDGTKGDNVAASKQCETKATNFADGANFLKVVIP